MKAPPFWPVLLALAVVSALTHTPALRQPHFEGDEVIFTFMAERVRQAPWNYSLRGPLTGAAARRFIDDTWLPLEVFQAELAGAPDDILSNIRRWYGSLTTAEVLFAAPAPGVQAREFAYDPTVYDRPMFFHPPVYPAALGVARGALNTIGGPLLSMGSHVALVIVVGLLGRVWWCGSVGLIAAALAVFDPVSLMAGSRLWIDSLLQTMVAASVGAAWWAVSRGAAWRAAIAGLVFGLACLTKIPAILAAPALLVTALVSPRRVTLTAAVSFGVAAGLLVVPWLLISKANYGAYLPAAYPTQWLIDHYDYVRVIVNRPWHFYASGLLLTAPILVFTLVGIAMVLTRLARRRARESEFTATIDEPRGALIALTWAAVVIGALWLLGTQRQGFQLRYLAPCTPALGLLAALGIAELWRGTRLVSLGTGVFALLLAGVTAVNATWSAWQPPAAEPVPIVFYWLLEHFGVDLWKALPGMWQLADAAA